MNRNREHLIAEHMLFMDMGATIKGLTFVDTYFAAIEDVPAV